MPATLSKPMTKEELEKEEDKENVKIGIAKRKKTKCGDSDSDSSAEVLKVVKKSKKQTEPFCDAEGACIAACMELNSKKTGAAKDDNGDFHLLGIDCNQAPHTSAHYDLGRKNIGATYVWSEAAVKALATGKKLKLNTREDYESLVCETSSEESDEDKPMGEFVACKGFAKFKREAIGEETPDPKHCTKCGKTPCCEACRHCERNPCIIGQEWDAAEEFVDFAIEEKCKLSEIRFGLYRMYARALGHKKRTVLPVCVTEFIRNNFPEPDGTSCIGFQPRPCVQGKHCLH